MPHIKVEVQILVTVNVYQQCDRWLWDCAICSANHYIWLYVHVGYGATVVASRPHNCDVAQTPSWRKTLRRALRGLSNTGLVCRWSSNEMPSFHTRMICNVYDFIRVWFVTCMICNVHGFMRIWFVACMICNVYDFIRVWFATRMVLNTYNF